VQSSCHIRPLNVVSSSSPRPYIIYRPPPGCGFWSNFSCVLQGLDYADRNGLVPVIDMERNPTLYNEDEPVHGVTNAWEYYFQQPSLLTLAEALTQDPVHNDGDISGRFTSESPPVMPPADLLARGRELVKKYIRLKPDIQAKLDAIIPVNAGRDMLGVHVRGTDMRKHRPPLHPAPNTTESYLEQAMLLDREFSYRQIFLACDELETVTLFRNQFGDRLLTIPAHRTAMDHTDMPREAGYKWLFEKDRDHHRYLLGLEVLLDALLLSRCRHLACGASNVSRGAIYFAPESQVVHSVPPLWLCPRDEGPSVGRSYLANVPPPARQPSAPVLQGQMNELYDLLEHTEKCKIDVHLNWAATNMALAEANEKLLRLQNVHQEKALLLKKIETLRKQVNDQKAMIEMLKSRLSTLINRWTRFGWNLMPWKKPSWRKQPFK
jgi:hypothetical protein